LFISRRLPIRRAIYRALETNWLRSQTWPSAVVSRAGSAQRSASLGSGRKVGSEQPSDKPGPVCCGGDAVRRFWHVQTRTKDGRGESGESGPLSTDASPVSLSPGTATVSCRGVGSVTQMVRSLRCSGGRWLGLREYPSRRPALGSQPWKWAGTPPPPTHAQWSVCLQQRLIIVFLPLPLQTRPALAPLRTFCVNCTTKNHRSNVRTSQGAPGPPLAACSPPCHLHCRRPSTRGPVSFIKAGGHPLSCFVPSHLFLSRILEPTGRPRATLPSTSQLLRVPASIGGSPLTNW
jgi:hypothetical protein